MAERNDQGFAVGDIDPRTSKPIVAIVTSNRSLREQEFQARERRTDQAADLNERQFEFQQEEAAANRTLREHEMAMRQANQYLELTKALVGMQEEARAKVDAADFLNAIKDKHLTDDDYDDYEAEQLMKNPRAPEDAAVKVILDRNRLIRSRHLEKKDIVERRKEELRASGHLPGETSTRQAIAAGHVTKDELKDLVDDKGKVDHVKVADFAAEKQGQGSGIKGATKEINDAYNFTLRYDPSKVEAMDEEDKQRQKAIYRIMLQKVIDFEESRRIKTPGTGQPKPSGAPAPRSASDYTR